MSFPILTVRTGEEPETDLYPDPADTPDTVELTAADGHCWRYQATALSVVSVAGARPVQLATISDVSISVGVTDTRVTLACSKFDKGGGWSGWGLAGFTVAVGANAVSKARARRRRRGRMLVGHVRYEWLGQIEAKDRSGVFGKNRIQLLLADPTGEAGPLVLDITLAKQADATPIAAAIARRAAALKAARQPDDFMRLALLAFATAPVRQTLDDGTARYVLPDIADPAHPSPQSATELADLEALPPDPAPPEPTPAHVPAVTAAEMATAQAQVVRGTSGSAAASANSCAYCGHIQRVAASACSNCGAALAHRSATGTGQRSVPAASVGPAQNLPIRDSGVDATTNRAALLAEVNAACTAPGEPTPAPSDPTGADLTVWSAVEVGSEVPTVAAADRFSIETRTAPPGYAQRVSDEFSPSPASPTSEPFRWQPPEPARGSDTSRADGPVLAVYRRGPVVAPPEIWLVAAALIVAAGFVLYPVLRYGFPIAGHIFDSNSFSRAFAALITFVFVLLGWAGVCLVLLATGLLRGTKVTRALTCLLCGAIAISELANSDSSAGAQGTSSNAVVIAVVCLAVALLVTVPPGARRFFALDEPKPLGVTAAVVCGYALGSLALLDGVLLMIVGSLGVKYVWYGIGFALAGLAFIALGRALRSGQTWARAAATAAYGAYVILNFALATDKSTIGTILPLLLVLGVVGLVWVEPVTGQFFAGGPYRLPALTPMARGGWAALLVVSVIMPIVGFVASSGAPSAFGGDSFSSPTVYANTNPVTPTGGPSTVPTNLNQVSTPRTWTLTEQAAGGHRFTLALAAGDPVHPRGVRNGSLAVGSACSVDPDTDAVVGATVTLTNVSGGPSPAGYRIQLGNTVDAAELDYTSGPDCETDSFSTRWQTPLAEGASGQCRMFLVLHNYYSSAHPDGDRDRFSDASVRFVDTTVSGDSGSLAITVGSPSGPGVADTDIPLAGTTSGAKATTSPASPTASATPPSSSAAVRYQLQVRVSPVTTFNCPAIATGQIAAYLAGHGCTGITRSMHTGVVGGRSVLLAVADVQFSGSSPCAEFADLYLVDGTGDINSLIADGRSFPGAPAAFADDPTYYAQPAEGSDDEVVTVKVMWTDGTATHANDPQLLQMLRDVAGVVA